MIDQKSREKALERMRELEEQESKGKFFSDKVGYPPVDSLDNLKKKACAVFTQAINELGVDDAKASDIAGAFGPLEIEAIYKHRTEILTLERILTLIDRVRATSFLNECKLKIQGRIGESGSFEHMPIDALVIKAEKLGKSLTSLLE